ncbi:MAG: tRNA threonylcarbamoyladenosine dehydratase [Saccharofermentanales bacterium]
MPEDRFDRTLLLWPPEKLEILRNKTVLVAGLGGVGSWAAEALARAGVGRLILVDCDVIAPSNLNRQLLALQSTLGQAKSQTARQRILDIDPAIEVIGLQERIERGQIDALLDRAAPVDYLLDAIDCLDAKVALIAGSLARDIPVLSAMGTGNRLDPTRLCLTDLSETSGDPMARRVRQLLKKEGIQSLKVVWSSEPPVRHGSRTVGSIPFVPPVAGFLMAWEAVRDLTSS